MIDDQESEKYFFTPMEINFSIKVASSRVSPRPRCSYPFKPGGSKSLYSLVIVSWPSRLSDVPGDNATPHSVLR